MKICVGNRCIPADDDVIANAQLQFAKQYGVGETTIIPNLGAGIFTQCKMDTIQGTMPAYNERLSLLAVKPFEREVAANDCVNAKAYVLRQPAVEPSARFE